MKTFLRISRLLTFFAAAALFISSASAQYWDSWTNTYSPTWTPLSLDQMTTKKSDPSWQINTYQSTTTTTDSKRTPPPSDLLVPAGGRAVRIYKDGWTVYLDDKKTVDLTVKVNFDTKEITFSKDYIPFIIGTVTHYNPGADSFGYVYPLRMEIDTKKYREVSDAVAPPENFTVPEDAIGVRIKAWADGVSGIQYLNNNLRVSGAKSDYANLKIINSSDAQDEVGVITINNYKQYNNVDSFGYIYPTKLNTAFYNKTGKDEFGLPQPPAGFSVPSGMLGVRIGDWGQVYYLKNNTLVSPTALGKLTDYTYDSATQKMVPATQFNIVDFNADGSAIEIGAITHYIQDADIYSYGYVFADAAQPSAPPETPPEPDTPTDIPHTAALPFTDVPDDAAYAEALLYALQNNWIKSAKKFKPKAYIRYCPLINLLFQASGKSVVKNNSKSKCTKKVRRKNLQSLLKKLAGRKTSFLSTRRKRYVRKWEAVVAAYEVFGQK